MNHSEEVYGLERKIFESSERAEELVQCDVDGNFYPASEMATCPLTSFYVHLSNIEVHVSNQCELTREEMINLDNNLTNQIQNP